jgi:hypothetical protein
VIPCSLAIDEPETITFSMEDGRECTASVIVRHCQGFHYASNLSPSKRHCVRPAPGYAAQPRHPEDGHSMRPTELFNPALMRRYEVSIRVEDKRIKDQI